MKGYLLLAFIGVLIITSTCVSADFNIASCPVDLYDQGTYTVTQNLVMNPATGNCFNINNNSITIDGGNYNITGNPVINQGRVLQFNTSANNTILRNVNVQRVDMLVGQGTTATSVSQVLLQNVTISGNRGLFRLDGGKMNITIDNLNSSDSACSTGSIGCVYNPTTNSITKFSMSNSYIYMGSYALFGYSEFVLNITLTNNTFMGNGNPVWNKPGLTSSNPVIINNTFVNSPVECGNSGTSYRCNNSYFNGNTYVSPVNAMTYSSNYTYNGTMINERFINATTSGLRFIGMTKGLTINNITFQDRGGKARIQFASNYVNYIINFSNITIQNSSQSQFGLEFIANTSGRIEFQDSDLGFINISKANTLVNGLVFSKSSYGKIEFGNMSSGLSAVNSTQAIQISQDFIYVNASTFLNSSNVSNLYLYNLSTSYTIPKIFAGSNECNMTTIPSCYNFTSLNAGIVKFNVSSFDALNFTILETGGAPPANTCAYSGSGNWFINCADNCSLLSPNTFSGNNNISIYGIGNINLSSIWTFTGQSQYIFMNGSCQFDIYHGGGFN